MKDCDDSDLLPIFVNAVDDDVRVFDKLARALYQSAAAHLSGTVQFEEADPITNPGDNVEAAATGLSLEIQTKMRSKSSSAASRRTTFIRRNGSASAR